MDNTQVLERLASIWSIIPTWTFYKTSVTNKLVPDLTECVFVFSNHKIKDPQFIEVKTDSKYFTIYKARLLKYNEPVGFIFIPNIPEGFNIRATPLTVAISSNRTNKSMIEQSNKYVIFEQYDMFELIGYDCSCEVVTDLGNKMGVFITGENGV